MIKTNFPTTSGKYNYTVSNFLNGISSGELDDGILPSSYAISSYNFDFSGGSLKNSLGFQECLLDLFDESVKDRISLEISSLGSIVKTYVYRNYNKQEEKRNDKLLLLTEDFGLFILNLHGLNTTLSRVRNITFTSIPSAISYRLNGMDVLIFTSETDNMVIYDGINEPYEVLDAPKISSADLHFERLFVTTINEKAQVLFSDDLDPTNWSIDLAEAGFIEMVDERGACNKVISFNDYLYVFRDYGISRITAFGDQEGFSVSHLFVSSAKIFPESVCVCGDRIIFLSSSGLYSFDGFSATKILDSISGLYADNNQNAIGGFFEGKYYLALNLKFIKDDDFNEEGFINNALLEYNISTKKYKIIRGVDVIDIQATNVGGIEKLFLSARKSSKLKYKIVTINNSGNFLNSPIKKSWKTGFYGFGKKQKNKCLRSVSLNLIGQANLKIVSDSGDSVILELSEGAKTYNTFIFGSKFAFEFYSDFVGEVRILHPELTIVCGGTN